MALETKEKLHISWLEETGVLVPCQSLWNTSLLLVKKPGNSDSYESDSSASPWQEYVNPVLLLNGQTQWEVKESNILGPGYPRI